jgi:hypothetical protein
MSHEEHSRVDKKNNSQRAGWVLVVSLLVVIGGVLPAATQASENATIPEPAIRRGVATAVAIRLRSGFAIAMRQVRDVQQCRALFEPLASDPERLLLRADYRPATKELETSYCSRRAVAVTHIGQPFTWICRTFSGLTAHEAAIVLIHEALHFGGLPESPRVSDAMTSQEINFLVISRCKP